MDTPITEKALLAQTRVQQVLEAGAHYIDADDVREALCALAFCERENKALLEKKTSAGRAYENHIAWLEDQLAKARASTGGSRELVNASISIRDRLVDYFRYVEESVPFEKAAEARERGTAIVDGMNWLIREVGNSRLAVQAVKAQRNQLEAEVARQTDGVLK